MGALGIRRFGSARRAIGLVAAGVVAVGLTACEPSPTDGRDLGVTAWDTDIFMRPGETRWTGYNVTNNGTDPVEEPIFVAVLPEGFGIASISSHADCEDHSNEEINLLGCHLDALAPSESVWIQVEIEASDEGGSGAIEAGVRSELRDTGPSAMTVSTPVSAPAASFTFSGQEDGPFVTGEEFALVATHTGSLTELYELELVYDTGLELISVTSGGDEAYCEFEGWGWWCEFADGVDGTVPLELTFEVSAGAGEQVVSILSWDGPELAWGETTVMTIGVE